MSIRLTRRYGFCASHRLHAPALSDEENHSIYGKCNNPHGHGHNYEVELTVQGTVDPITGRVVDLRILDQMAEREILKPLKFRNLNTEVPELRDIVPTTENLTRELDRRLRAAWPQAFPEASHRLEMIRIRETDRNICEIWG